METVTIKETSAQLSVTNSCIAGAVFNDVKLSKATFFNVAMDGIKIENANLSDVEINDAQIGGAYVHGIGLPPAGHPMHKPGVYMRPVRFEDCYLAGSTINNCNLSNIAITDCNLTGSTINDCNLSNVAITDCNVTGMTINGVLVTELLALYNKQ